MAPQFLRRHPRMLANPAAKVGWIAEPATATDFGNFVRRVAQSQAGFLKANVRHVVDDGHARVLMEESAERTAVIAQARRNAFGRKLRIREFRLDNMLRL